jgi:hypothetical protein
MTGYLTDGIGESLPLNQIVDIPGVDSKLNALKPEMTAIRQQRQPRENFYCQDMPARLEEIVRAV